MNVVDALESLKSGRKVRSEHDDKSIYYVSYHQEKIGRIHADVACAGKVINLWNDEDFVKDHWSFNFEFYYGESE